jgi:hypothetical protein
MTSAPCGEPGGLRSGARSRALRRASAALLGLALAAAVVVVAPGGAEPAAAQCAPSVSVSKVDGLAPGGETVSVNGTCFDVSKGVYVAFCVVPPPGQPPSPCGGGVAMEGSGGLSHWISSTPPPYAQGLTTPWGPGGTFSVTLTPSAALSPTVDCVAVQCAVATRADHTRAADRSQDVIVPVSFSTGAVAPPAPEPMAPPATEAPLETVPETTTTAPESTVPETTVPETTTTTVAPTTTSDGTAVDAELAAGGPSDGGSSTGVVIGVVAAVVLVAGIGTGVAVRRRSASTEEG